MRGGGDSVTAVAASAAVRECWTAAVPAPTWNIAPNEREAINAISLSPSQTVFATMHYRRYGPEGRQYLALTPGQRGQRRTRDAELGGDERLDDRKVRQCKV